MQGFGGASPPNASRYELLVKVASGGMATVYVGRLHGAMGFWRLVAIKRAHPHIQEDPKFKQMLVDEAHIAARIHHPNVVSVLDVEDVAGDFRLVLDYIEGAALSELLFKEPERGELLPARLAVRIALDVSLGLHAAHTLTDESDEPLNVVHRDVSPQNILVGIDGSARLTDFGIAKHAGSAPLTATGVLRGKIGYMAPEYIKDGAFNAQSDVFALGVVLWEALARQRLFSGSNEMETMKRIVHSPAPPLSSVVPSLDARVSRVLEKALERSPERRFASAEALAEALAEAAKEADLVGSHAEVRAFVRSRMGAALLRRREQIRQSFLSAQGTETAQIARPRAFATPKATVDTTVEAEKSHGNSVSLRSRASPASRKGAGRLLQRWVIVPVLVTVAAGGIGLMKLGRGTERQVTRGPVSAKEDAASPAAEAATALASSSSADTPVPSASMAPPPEKGAKRPAPAGSPATVTARPMAKPTALPVDTVAPNPYTKGGSGQR